jgi:hypothetical protein
MSVGPVDYARFGRQIALPEIGPAGQRRLGSTAVRFEPASALVASTHQRAGGLVADEATVVVTVPAGPANAMAAWASIEAARRVLGASPQGLPEGLLARLGG